MDARSIRMVRTAAVRPRALPEEKIERQSQQQTSDGGIGLGRLVDERVDQEKERDGDENKRGERIAERLIRTVQVPSFFPEKDDAKNNRKMCANTRRFSGAVMFFWAQRSWFLTSK